MLRTFRGWGLLSAVVAASLALAAGEARAAVISFSTTSDTETINMLNGNQATVAIAGRTGSVDLTAGVAQTVRLHTASLSGLPLSADFGTGSLSHTLSITSPASTPSSASIGQPVSAEYGSFLDPFGAATIGPRAAGPVSFNLGTTGTLTVTVLGGSVNDPAFDGDPVEFDNNATFLLTAPIPEPVALPLLAGVAGLALARRRGGR